jgi:hypothetical protein
VGQCEIFKNLKLLLDQPELFSAMGKGIFVMFRHIFIKVFCWGICEKWNIFLMPRLIIKTLNFARFLIKL